ncbi:unnamed protein product, partial [Darwinula stevensoni]
PLKARMACALIQRALTTGKVLALKCRQLLHVCLNSSSTTPEWIELGHIVDAFGLDGSVKIHPYNPNPEALLTARIWHLQPNLLLPNVKHAQAFKVKVIRSKVHGASVIAKLIDIDDRDDAIALKGCVVCITRDQLPTLNGETDGYYWVDLIGCQVRNQEDELIGKVDRLIDNGVQQVLCVKRTLTEGEEFSEFETLIPFVNQYVLNVDIAAKLIKVDWGMDY